MAKRYFSVGQKERVRDRLVSRAFDPRKAVLDKAERELAQGLYESVYSREHRRLMDSLPQGWLPVMGTLWVDPGPGSSNERFDLDGSRRHPAQAGSTVRQADLPEVTRALVDEHVAARRLLTAEREATRREVWALLSTFRTIDEAVAKWPEAADIIREVVGEPRPRALPALTTLNAALDLPPEENEK